MGGNVQTIDIDALRDFPDPTPTDDSLRFWERAGVGKLEVQRCKPCGRGIFPPRPSLCPYCHGELVWTETDPAASVYSWIGVDRAIHPWARAAVPFTVVIAALRAYPDVRIPCYFPDSRHRLAIGRGGTILFHDIGRTYPLLGFELTEQVQP